MRRCLNWPPLVLNPPADFVESHDIVLAQVLSDWISITRCDDHAGAARGARRQGLARPQGAFLSARRRRRVLAWTGRSPSARLQRGLLIVFAGAAALGYVWPAMAVAALAVAVLLAILERRARPAA